MIIEVSPESSLLVRGAAATVLFLHIAGGTIGIISGGTALMVRKGGPLHRFVGNAFFVSMLIMATMGAVASPFLPIPEWVNLTAAALTFYLVATAWMTVKNSEIVRRLEIGACAFAVAIAIGGVTLAVLETNNPGSVGPNPLGGLVFGGIALLAAAGDLKMFSRNGISGRQRVGRHLWRMCLALLIGSVSLFLGQPQVFPESIRGTGLLYLPVVAVFAAMMFWIFRVRFAKRWQHVQPSA